MVTKPAPSFDNLFLLNGISTNSRFSLQNIARNSNIGPTLHTREIRYEYNHTHRPSKFTPDILKSNFRIQHHKTGRQKTLRFKAALNISF